MCFTLRQPSKRGRSSKLIISTPFLFIFRPSSAPGRVTRKPTLGTKKAALTAKPKGTLLDARTKIIQKKRYKIRDAREIIADNARKTIKDARELLSTRKPALRQPQPRKTAGIRTARRTPTVPKFLIDDDDDGFDITDLSELNLKPIGSFKRTVHNDMFRTSRTIPPVSMPKLPKFSIRQELSRMSPDPFDCYNVPTRHHVPVPPVRPERVERYQPGRIMSAHMDAYMPSKSILRSSQADDHDDRFASDRYFSTTSSDSVRSRLFSDRDRLDRNESAGIFANLPVRASSPPPAQSGHRIVISNLHTSVTESDVRELFEDIGTLSSAKLTRPGIAEVIFKDLGDAEAAVETYHNRQLDGQPMKCMLVRSNSKPTYSSRL